MIRKCLYCDKPFKSRGNFNRICPACKYDVIRKSNGSLLPGGYGVSSSPSKKGGSQ